MQFKFVLFLTVLTSFFEVISLGSVVPFIAIITQSDSIFNYPLMSKLSHFLSISSPEDMIGPISLIFITAAILAGFLRVLLLRFSIVLSNAIGADLSAEMFSRTLYQPYIVHLNRSSSDVISGITQKVATATSVLAAFITFITNLFLFIAIFMALLFIDPFIAGITFGAFGLVYIIISVASKKILNKNSFIIANQQTNAVRSSQEGLGAIRDVLVNNRQKFYSLFYRDCVWRLQKAIGTNQFITLAPRYIMETFALVLIGTVTFLVSSSSTPVNSLMPTLGALGLGAQRLLPVLQQLYGNLSLVVGSRQSLADVLFLLEQPMPERLVDSARSMVFKKDIKFEQLSFSYSNKNSTVLSKLNLQICKGETIGFVGETGSGKSTAIDLILGLLNPRSGKILIDGIEINKSNVASWQNLLTHVPQHIYLADASIAENIAFGISLDDINYEKVHQVGTQAQLDEFVGKLPNGYATVVGERGVKFSGGQRQRIGIARALYKEASVLILDEATSALDTKTEELVMNTVHSLGSDLTVIIIAHRIHSLKRCDQILEFVGNGKCLQLSYQSFLKKNK